MASLMEQAIDATLYFGRFRLEEADRRLADIIKKAAAGDTDAFNSLVIKLEPKLRATARARSRGVLSDDDIDDVMQDAWMEMMKPAVLDKFADDPGGLVPFMHSVVKNKTINMGRAKARAGKTYKHIGVDPATLGAMKAGRGGGKLSAAERRIVRKAVTKALAKAKLTPQERMFVAMLFGQGDVPEYGGDVAKAGLVGIRTGKTHKTVKGVGTWAFKAKRKFLRHFCTDKALCDLLPSGRGRTKVTKIPGLGAGACKGVEGSCVESDAATFAHRVCLLDEGHPEIDEGDAGELVLSWLTDVLART